MHVQKKKLASGVRYYLRYWKDGKNKCIPKHLYPDFKTKVEALTWIKNNQAKVGAKLDLKKYTEAKKRHEWRNNFHDFNELGEMYRIWQKREAPNSWKNNMFYLENYVYGYFLNIKDMNNINTWHTEFANYRNWLEFKATTLRTEDLISYSTKNHCIRTLNNFLKCMEEHRLLDPKLNMTCRAFAQKLVDENARTYKDIISEEEYQALKKKLVYSKDFFTILYNTGMRFGELYSLPISAIRKGTNKLPRVFVDELEIKHNKKIYGYIYLKSQLKVKNMRKRDNKGELKRKPLKGRDNMGYENARLIPITDKETWNIIVRNYNISLDEFKKKKYKSTNMDDYLLLSDLSATKLRVEFRKHCTKGYHSTRHSFASYFTGMTLNQTLCRIILGHKNEAFERYNHIYEAWNIEVNGPEDRQHLLLVEELKEVS